MLFIKDFGLEHFISKESLNKYKNIAQSSLPLEEKIVQLLTINPKFMTPSAANKEEEQYKKTKHRKAIKLIKEKLDENKKLEFFSLAFHTKPHTKKITNGFVFPDVAEFLSLLHLNIIFKHINNIYKPGATLKIGCQFFYFRTFNNISDSQAEEMNEIIFSYNRIAKEMLQTEDFVQIYDLYESIEPYKKEFFIQIENEKFNILQDEKNLIKMQEGADYFLNYVVDISQFPNKEAASNFCLYHTLDSAAFRNIIFSAFETKSGLFERLSENIKVETRFQSGAKINDQPNSIFISFLPGSSTLSFNRLTLKRNDGTWELVTYEDIINRNAESVFVKESSNSNPFYFKEKNNGKNL